MTLRFLAEFQFSMPWFLNFLFVLFPLHFFQLFLNHCSVLLLLQSVLAIFSELLHYMVASFEVLLFFPFFFAFLWHR